MLEHRHRLTTSAGFTAATRRGRRAGTRTLVAHLTAGRPTASTTTEPPATGPGGPRVGFVVSKAVGNAVVRNRVKRRLRHLVRERLSSLPNSTVLVVRALPAAATASYDGLGRDLDTALRRLQPTPGGAR